MLKTPKLYLKITATPLSLEECYQFVLQRSCGAINLFVGTVRDYAEGRSVERLEYHGYAEMAEAVLAKICEQAFGSWELGKIAVHHRVGLLEITEPSLVIAVSAPHREEAFSACRFIIEAIKKDLPVWKKEHFAGGGKTWKGIP